MTDNRTTELLREGLTERGIEWRSGLKGVTFVGDWCFVEYDNGNLAATCEPVLTPEQAIAATLGDDGYRQAADYWKRMYEELLTERIGEERDYPEHDGRYECPDCGNVVFYDELYGGGWTIYVEDYQIPFNACPNCGKAVRR